MRRCTVAQSIVLACAICFTAAEVKATAIGYSMAETAVEVIDSGGMTVSVLDTSFVPLPALVGGVTVTDHVGINTAGVGLMVAETGVSADVPPPPFALADAISFNDDLVTLINSGTGAATASFFMSYSLETMASTTDPLELASARAFVHISGIDSELLMLDTGMGLVAAPEFELELLSAVSSGDAPDMKAASGSLFFTVTVDPGVHSFSIITDSEASAIAEEVPEPTALAMLCSLGLVAAGWRRRRR